VRPSRRTTTLAVLARTRWRARPARRGAGHRPRGRERAPSRLRTGRHAA